MERFLRAPRNEAATERVRHSWLRCFQDYALDPLQPRKPRIIDGAELRRRRAQAGLAYAIVKAEMLRACEALELPCGMAFTDADGVILQYVGAGSFTDVARQAGFTDGAVWSEAEQGTNGMGTCLVVREPIIIERHEHFLAQNVDLTCYAAPIHDVRGMLLGVLDISCHVAQPRAPMLALLRLVVANIESRLLAAVAADGYLLRFHRRHEYLDTALEGVLLFDDLGVITGANAAALRLLEITRHDEVCGSALDAHFKLDQPRADEPPPHSAPLLRSSGERFGFGRLELPAEMCRRTARSGNRNPLASAERAALVDVLEQCRWNVSEAARRLGLGRKTLYRKLHKHALRRR